MASLAKDLSTGGDGSQSDNTKFVFSRSANRSRVPVAFNISAKGQQAVVASYSFDETSEKWEEKTPTQVVCRVLSTTRSALRLDGGKYDTVRKGTKSASKTYKIKVLSVESTIKRTIGSRPTGKPAKYTTYSFNVPSWCNLYVFCQSIWAALRAEVNVWDGIADPKVGEIVSVASPWGIVYSTATLEAVFKSDAPKKRESSRV
jgi:hypothetical protein